MPVPAALAAIGASGASLGGGAGLLSFLPGVSSLIPGLGSLFGGNKTQVTTNTNTTLGVAANPIVGISIGGGAVSPTSGGNASPSIDATSNPSQGGDNFGLPNFYSPQPSQAAKFPGITDFPLSGNATAKPDNLPLLLALGGGVLMLMMFAGKGKA